MYREIEFEQVTGNKLKSVICYLWDVNKDYKTMNETYEGSSVLFDILFDKAYIQECIGYAVFFDEEHSDLRGVVVADDYGSHICALVIRDDTKDMNLHRPLIYQVVTCNDSYEFTVYVKDEKAYLFEEVGFKRRPNTSDIDDKICLFANKDFEYDWNKGIDKNDLIDEEKLLEEKIDN